MKVLVLQSVSKLDQAIWDEYSKDQERLHKTAQAIREIVKSNEMEAYSQVDMTNTEIEEFPEGRILFNTHRRIERSRQASRKKKESIKRKKGKLECEVCSFNFSRKYGGLGKDYIECHHNVPLADIAESKKNETC